MWYLYALHLYEEKNSYPILQTPTFKTNYVELVNDRNQPLRGWHKSFNSKTVLDAGDTTLLVSNWNENVQSIQATQQKAFKWFSSNKLLANPDINPTVYFFSISQIIRNLHWLKMKLSWSYIDYKLATSYPEWVFWFVSWGVLLRTTTCVCQILVYFGHIISYKV